MKHGRASVTAPRVHALPPNVRRVRAASRTSLCGTLPTSTEHRPGWWRGTEEPVDCRRCLGRLEQLADYALVVDPFAHETPPSRRVTVALPRG